MAITNVLEAYGSNLIGSHSSGTNITNMTQLSDVDISSPTNGEILTYNSTTSEWQNKSVTIPVNPSDTTNLNIWIEVDDE